MFPHLREAAPTSASLRHELIHAPAAACSCSNLSLFVACLSAEVLLLLLRNLSPLSLALYHTGSGLTLILSWRSHLYSDQVVSLNSVRLSDPHRCGNDTPELLSAVLDLRSAVKDVVLPEPERTASPGLPPPARGLDLRNPRRRRCEYAG